MPSVATLYVRLKADTRDYHAKLRRASASMREFGGSMESFGRSASMQLTAPILIAGGAATKFANDMNAGMANVATMIPGNIARVQELKRNVQDMAIATGKSTGDLAGGMYQVISAFQDSADSAELLNIAARSSVAGVSSTTDAINLLSAITKGYGDVSVDSMRKAADLSFEIVRQGQTTFPELAASMGRVVPFAAALKVKQTELAAGMATLTGVTGGAAEVSTQLSAVMRAMMKQTPEMAAAIGAQPPHGLGYATAQSMIASEGLVGALRQLIGTTDGTQEAVTKLFGRAEALTAVFAITGGQAETFDKKLDAMADSAGAMGKAFDAQAGGINKFGHWLRQLRQYIVVLAQRAGDILIPHLLEMRKHFTALVTLAMLGVQWFGGLDNKWQRLAISGAAVAATIGPMAIVAGQLLKLLPLLGIGSAAVGGKFLLIAAAATVVGLAIATFAGDAMRGLTALYNIVKGALVDAFNAAFNSVRTGLTAAFNWIVDGFKSMAERVSGWIDWLGRGLSKMFGVDVPAIMGPVAEEMFRPFETAASAMGGAIEIGARETANVFKQMWTETSAEVARVWTDIGKGFVTQIMRMVDTGGDLVDTFRTKWAELGAGMQLDFSTAMENIEQQMLNMPPLLDGPTEKMEGYLDRLQDAGVSAMDGMADALAEFTTAGKLDFRDFANSVIRDLMRIQYQEALTRVFQYVRSSFSASGGFEGVPAITDGEVPTIDIGGAYTAQPMSGLTAATAGGPAVVINDHRAAGSPDIEVSENTIDGRQQLVLTVRDIVRTEIDAGNLDPAFARLGVFRPGRRR